MRAELGSFLALIALCAACGTPATTDYVPASLAFRAGTAPALALALDDVSASLTCGATAVGAGDAAVAVRRSDEPCTLTVTVGSETSTATGATSLSFTRPDGTVSVEVSGSFVPTAPVAVTVTLVEARRASAMATVRAHRQPPNICEATGAVDGAVLCNECWSFGAPTEQCQALLAGACSATGNAYAACQCAGADGPDALDRCLNP
jgi:hypothetical protein